MIENTQYLSLSVWVIDMIMDLVVLNSGETQHGCRLSPPASQYSSPYSGYCAGTTSEVAAMVCSDEVEYFLKYLFLKGWS